MIIRKINRLLTNKQRISYIFLIAGLTVSAILELIGIYLITHIVETFDTHLAAAAIVFYIVKNAFQIWICKVQYTYIYKCQLTLSKQLISGYLNKPYIFHTQTNSAELLRNIVIDSERFYQLVLNILMLFSEIMVALLLGIFLLITDLITTVFVAFTLAVLVILYFLVVKNRMKKYGVMNHDSDKNMHKAIKEALGAVKDIKITHREGFFVDRFVENGEIKTDAQIKNNILNLLPKYLFELVCVSMILIIVILKLYNGENINSMLPELTAFVIAVFKLLPSVTKINNYVNQIVFLKPSVDLVYNDLNEMKREKVVDSEGQNYGKTRKSAINNDGYAKMVEEREKPIFDHDNSRTSAIYQDDYQGKKDNAACIRFDNVSYNYPASDVSVLLDTSFDIMLGKSIGIIGPTGAGKSTLADVLLGILTPVSGHVMYGDMDVHQSSREWADKLAYIPQSIYLSDDTIRRNIAFGIIDKDIDEDKVNAAVKEAQLSGFIESLPDGLDTEVGEMGVRISGGQRQRIGIARALYSEPEIIVLDEATSALDKDTESAVMDAINRLHGKKTLIIIAHRLSTIEKCDMVYKVENGKVEKVR